MPSLNVVATITITVEHDDAAIVQRIASDREQAIYGWLIRRVVEIKRDICSNDDSLEISAEVKE